MKAIVLISSLLISTHASAVVVSIPNPNHIIDPPRIGAKLAIVTPNTGPIQNPSPAPTEQPFPGQASLVSENSGEPANFLENDAYDPASPDAEAILRQYDALYEQETGLSAFPTGATVDRGNIDPAVQATLGTPFEGLLQLTADGCVRQGCAVWAVVSKRSQTITIYVNGSPIALPNNRTSSGAPGHGTPDFDKHPDGRIYTKYSSKKFPGGDWNGLGNMPYAVFIRGGYALHGTPSIGSLGRPASHGCIRLHPHTGKLFNGLVRQYGVANTWITVK